MHYNKNMIFKLKNKWCNKSQLSFLHSNILAVNNNQNIISSVIMNNILQQIIYEVVFSY